jgi:hypothetical protein
MSLNRSARARAASSSDTNSSTERPLIGGARMSTATKKKACPKKQHAPVMTPVLSCSSALPIVPQKKTRAFRPSQTSKAIVTGHLAVAADASATR